MSHRPVTQPTGPRNDETWIDCKFAQTCWEALTKTVRADLRAEVGNGVENRIRGGPEKLLFAKVKVGAARAWARIAGIEAHELMIDKPPDGHDTQDQSSEEIEDYITTCEDRIVTSLSKSEPLLTHLCRAHIGADAAIDLATCAEDVARILLKAPRPALLKLREAAHVFELPQRPDAIALGAIRQIVREIVLLIYDETEIARVRDALGAAGSIALTIPAATATAAEVVMARLDRRGALFEDSGEGRWPRGKSAIPLPAESIKGDDYLATLGERIEEHLFTLTLDPDELALDAPLKRDLATAALGGRNIRKFGALYCLLTLEIAAKYRKLLQDRIDVLASAWPAVRFIHLDGDPKRHVEEKALIWALKDYLHDA